MYLCNNGTTGLLNFKNATKKLAAGDRNKLQLTYKVIKNKEKANEN